ncbi:hypothetical protein J4423_04255 [Candidatus Pacearchaeota archaeon]|nr:hypothetical protein [Candidatus Pacearchaeota archaeon]
METSSYVGKNVNAIFAHDRFIYHVNGVLVSTDEDHVNGESGTLHFKNAILSASGIMFGDIKPRHLSNGYGTEIASDLRELSKSKRLSMDKKDLVAIMELESK